MKITKRMHLWAVALILGTLLLDIGFLELRYIHPRTTHDSDSNFIKNPTDYGALLMRVGEAKGKPCDIIFVGASNVEYWLTEGREIWDKRYAPRNAFDFGVAGDKTENVLWRFDHIDLTGIHPKIAVVFIGLNNAADTPHAIALGVKAISNKVRKLFPGIRVIMVSLTPNERNPAEVPKANELLRKYANNHSIFYVDIYSLLPPEGDGWKGLKPDHTHFTKEGYQIWADAMEPVLSQFVPMPGSAPAPPLPPLPPEPTEPDEPAATGMAPR